MIFVIFFYLFFFLRGGGGVQHKIPKNSIRNTSEYKNFDVNVVYCDCDYFCE